MVLEDEDELPFLVFPSPVHSAVGAEEAEIVFWKWRLSHILASHDNRSSGSWWTKMHSGIRRLVSIETCKQTQAHVSMSCARVWHWRIPLPLRSLVDRMKRGTRRQLRTAVLLLQPFHLSLRSCPLLFFVCPSALFCFHFDIQGVVTVQKLRRECHTYCTVDMTFMFCAWSSLRNPCLFWELVS